MQSWASACHCRRSLLAGSRAKTCFRDFELRTSASAIIPYLLDDVTASIVGVFCGGQDCETALGPEDE